MNNNFDMNKPQFKMEDIDAFRIQSFLNFCKIISVLIVILSMVLAIVSFVATNIGAGIGYMFGGIMSGMFLWKFSELFCGFLYDVKVIRTLIKEALRNGVLLDVKSIKNQLEKITQKMDDNNVGGKTND